MYTNLDAADAQIDTLLADQMSRLQARRRRFFTIFHLLPARYVWSILSLFFVTVILFSAVLYLNFDSIANLVSPPFVPISPKKNTGERPTSSVRRGLSFYDTTITYNDYNYLKPDNLTYKTRTYSKSIEVLFRLPKKVRITALLLIFHGCGRSAHDWFHTIERQRIIGAAIDLGFGCVAFQATNQLNRCWSHEIDLYNNPDVKMVSEGLEGIFDEYPKLENLPRFTFGASSGGIFSSIFVVNQRFIIQGQILFISIVAPDVLETYVKAKHYPPTAWIYMTRDVEFASEDRINSSIKVFVEQQIPYQTFDITPIPLTSKTFHERIPTISLQTSHYIFYRLQQNKWLTTDSLLAFNPRRTSTWKTFLSPLQANTTEMAVIRKNLEQNQQVLPDFLNTIYGEHEISFERSYEALKWHRDMYRSRQNITI